MAEDLRGGLFTNLAHSVKGAVNATRSARMTPAERKKFEARVLAKRKREAQRKSPERAVKDAVQTRNAGAGVDLRAGVNPKAALKRRMKKAGAD